MTHRENPHRRHFHVPAALAVAAGASTYSPIYCCGDDTWNPPGSGPLPAGHRPIQVRSNLIDWWISLDNADPASVVEIQGDSTVAFATPVTWIQHSTPGIKIYGTQVVLDPTMPLNSVGAGVQLPQLRSPFPFWRWRFTAGAAPYAAVRLAVVAGGLP